MLETSLVSFSRSYLSLSSWAAAGVGLAAPLCCGAVAEGGRGGRAPLVVAKAGLKSSASWKAIACSCSSVSR